MNLMHPSKFNERKEATVREQRLLIEELRKHSISLSYGKDVDFNILLTCILQIVLILYLSILVLHLVHSQY